VSYKQAHIIGQQSIEIDFDNLDNAFGVQERIAELFYEKLQPKMEALFDDMFERDRVVYMEKLEVDCETLSIDNWEEEWVETALRKLTDQLRQADKTYRSIDENCKELLFYLGHGYLPWNSRVRSLIQFETSIIIDARFIRQVLKLIRQDQLTASRLVRNFREGFVKRIIETAAHETGLSQHSFEELTGENKITAKTYAVVAEAILVALSSEKVSLQELKKDINNTMAKFERHKKETQPPKQLKKLSDKKEEEAIYISNAGLAIFNPFVPLLFERLDFTKEGVWEDERKQQQGTMALQYLVNGLEKIDESDLVFPKIICGLDPEDIITEDIIITRRIKDACDELTQELIGQWTALKNTGIESFRNTFIQREGKLSRVDHGWLLQVERKSVDILLNSLPWGIGIIRLPWMKEIVFTEWAY
jgi:Contractile injection system tape measure protein